MKGFYEVRFGSEVFRMRISGSVSFLDRLEVELFVRGLSADKGWRDDWRTCREFTCTSATGERYTVLKLAGEDVICVNPTPAYDVYYETVSKSGDDWRVIVCGGLALIERNQGAHSRRFFPVGGAYTDPMAAAEKCKRLAAGWPYTRFN